MRTSTLSCLLTGTVLCAAAGGLLRFPQEISQAVRDGLFLCWNTLLPSLFPFFVLSALIVNLGLSACLGQWLEPLMQPLFHLPGVCSSPLILGLLGGYPTGARTAVALYQNGQCTREQAQRLLSFCNNCGPAFLIGTVGVSQFGHLAYGLLLAGVHICAAFISGIILGFRAPKEPVPLSRRSPEPFLPLSRAFTDAVTGSMQSLLNLFSFVLCFSAILQLFRLTGIPALVTEFLHPLLTGTNGEQFFLGFFEMSSGVTALRDGPQEERLILASALLGWGGLSVHCQVLSILKDCDLSPVPYLKGKALHALLSAILMALLLRQAEALCLISGITLLYLPTALSKKAVENPRKVYYNGSSLTKEPWYP